MALYGANGGGLGRRRRSGLLSALTNRGLGAFPQGGPVMGNAPMPAAALSPIGGGDPATLVQQQMEMRARANTLAGAAQPMPLAGGATGNPAPPRPVGGGGLITQPPAVTAPPVPQPILGGLASHTMRGQRRRRPTLSGAIKHVGMGGPGY